MSAVYKSGDTTLTSPQSNIDSATSDYAVDIMNFKETKKSSLINITKTSSQKYQISSNTPVTSVTIFSSNGKIIKKITGNNIHSFTFPKVSAGKYYTKIKTNANSIMKTLTIQ